MRIMPGCVALLTSRDAVVGNAGTLSGALWRLGLHPDQPRSRIISRPLPPSHVKKILAERLALEAWQ
ncbi:hypothetical protein Areg01_33810 [Actinoplanes regularis]|nr:hypothetical protein Areg01_33810 [Actinoplanes regularis]